MQGWGADAAPALAGSSWANMAASGSDAGTTSAKAGSGKKPNKQRKGGLSMFLSGAPAYHTVLQQLCLDAYGVNLFCCRRQSLKSGGWMLTGALEKTETSMSAPSITTHTGVEAAPWRLAPAAPAAPTSLRAILNQEVAAGNQVRSSLTFNPQLSLLYDQHHVQTCALAVLQKPALRSLTSPNDV